MKRPVRKSLYLAKLLLLIITISCLHVEVKSILRGIDSAVQNVIAEIKDVVYAIISLEAVSLLRSDAVLATV
jgi:hypothetical protein